MSAKDGGEEEEEEDEASQERRRCNMLLLLRPILYRKYVRCMPSSENTTHCAVTSAHC